MARDSGTISAFGHNPMRSGWPVVDATGRSRAAFLFLRGMNLFEGGENLRLLGMIPRGFPFGDRQIEAPDVFGLADQAFFQKHAGKPIGQGQGRLSQNAGPDNFLGHDDSLADQAAARAPFAGLA